VLIPTTPGIFQRVRKSLMTVVTARVEAQYTKGIQIKPEKVCSIVEYCAVICFGIG
jgi:hypothetical protein